MAGWWEVMVATTEVTMLTAAMGMGTMVASSVTERLTMEDSEMGSSAGNSSDIDHCVSIEPPTYKYQDAHSCRLE